ncbi:SHOCT domain-containing protein [Prochlorococcus sp. MIT 1223]|uniref:SHOCT domain-containing protein n=1 Tax=Prochlorococcus sp. MIT 1223 TaxID=3096217 RepID=UPI002A757E80|nr:SHOCT domain-containing protein [Prochlorococcus sp. MIT 1223]
MVFYIIFGIILIGYTGYVFGKQETRNIEQRIAKARDLRDRNVITEEEYQSVRRKIVLDA